MNVINAVVFITEPILISLLKTDKYYFWKNWYVIKNMLKEVYGIARMHFSGQK